MKKIKLAIIIIILAVVITVSVFTLKYTKEGNALIATNFVKNEATYKFDGIPESFKLNDTVSLKCRYCWEFHFEYQSRNSGYGDRTNATVNSVITSHTAVIAMENGTITSAVLDNKWDMKLQKPLTQRMRR